MKVDWVRPMSTLGQVTCDAEAHNRVVKTQAIRLLDVFVIGPLMIYGASKMPIGPAAALLAVFGISTVIYNGVNYFEVKELQNAR